MKVLLDIKDHKASFVMELLNSLSFVKVQPLTPYKAEVLDGVREAVNEMKAVKEGRMKGKPVSELISEI